MVAKHLVLIITGQRIGETVKIIDGLGRKDGRWSARYTFKTADWSKSPSAFAIWQKYFYFDKFYHYSRNLAKSQFSKMKIGLLQLVVDIYLELLIVITV